MNKKMINVLVFVFALLLGSMAISAQDEDKNTIALTGVYARRSVDVKLPEGGDFRYDADNDSIGGEFSYMRFPFKYLGIGMEGGVTFHNKSTAGTTSCGTGCTVVSRGTSKVALGYANYVMQLQRRKGIFQPFINGTIGVQRGDFGGVTRTNGGAIQIGDGGTQFVYGGGGGFDIKVGKKVYWRTGLAVTQAFGGDTKQVDVKVKTGLAFQF